MTCVIDVEAVFNQRLSTYVTEDGEDLVPLTPAMFLREISEAADPQISTSWRETNYKDDIGIWQDIEGQVSQGIPGGTCAPGKGADFPTY